MRGREPVAGPIVVAIEGDNRGLNTSIGQSESRIGKFGKVAAGVGRTVARGVAVGVVALGAFGVASVKAASDAEQSLGASETVFGKYADTVVKQSRRADTQLGLSANSYRESANLIGSLFRNQGVAADQLAGKTRGMIKTGADLAATYGGTTAQAARSTPSLRHADRTSSPARRSKPRSSKRRAGSCSNSRAAQSARSARNPTRSRTASKC
jgi:hypothetical protein